MLHSFQDVFVFPAADAAFRAVGAFVFDDAGGAITRPVRSDRFAILLAREPIDQLLASRADVSVSLGVIGEVSFIELSPRTSVGGLRLGNDDRDAGLFAGKDFLTLVIPLVRMASIRSVPIASRAATAIIDKASLS